MKQFSENPELPYMEALGYFLRFVHSEEAQDDPHRRFYVSITTGKQNPSDQDMMRHRDLGKMKFMNLKTRWQGNPGFIYGKLALTELLSILTLTTSLKFSMASIW